MSIFSANATKKDESSRGLFRGYFREPPRQGLMLQREFTFFCVAGILPASLAAFQAAFGCIFKGKLPSAREPVRARDELPL
jgi:hypothetical protein